MASGQTVPRAQEYCESGPHFIDNGAPSMTLAATVLIILIALYALLREADVRLELFLAGLALAMLVAQPLVVFDTFLVLLCYKLSRFMVLCQSLQSLQEVCGGQEPGSTI